MIFVFDMLVIMLMDLGNCKNWVVPKLTNWRKAYWETTSRIVQNLTNPSYRGGANLKISIFLLNMFVCMLIELENHKILQAGCFWSWQIKEEGKLSSIDISGQLLWVPKKFWSQKSLVLKNFGSENYFASQKSLVPKILESWKNLGPKRFLVMKVLLTKEKRFGWPTNFGSKKFWVTKYMGPEKIWTLKKY